MINTTPAANRKKSKSRNLLTLSTSRRIHNTLNFRKCQPQYLETNTISRESKQFTAQS